MFYSTFVQFVYNFPDGLTFFDAATAAVAAGSPGNVHLIAILLLN